MYIRNLTIILRLFLSVLFVLYLILYTFGIDYYITFGKEPRYLLEWFRNTDNSILFRNIIMVIIMINIILLLPLEVYIFRFTNYFIMNFKLLYLLLLFVLLGFNILSFMLKL